MLDRTRFAAAAALALVMIAGLRPSGVAAAPSSIQEVAVVRTPFGEFAWRFFDAEAPGHAAYVRDLIRAGFYDGTTFHRVIPRFVVQGGDPNSRNDRRSDDGDGEADRRLKAEFSRTLHYRPGTVGMARDEDPDSGSCQFFVALEDLPRLDGRYTIFGEVFYGMDVARRIADQPRDLKDNPLEPVPITVRIEKRRVPSRVWSMKPGEAGREVLSGPDKPARWDPEDARWVAPALRSGGSPPSPASRPRRLELAIGSDGAVLDVRFPDLETAGAAALRAAALEWRFSPATFDGAPRKVRVAIDSDGANLGAVPAE